MGTYNGGILGRFSGKVGAVIGAMFRGTAVMKGLPTPSSKPPTLKQLMQQSKFALITGFLRGISEFIKVGYQNHSSGATPMNAAVKYHLENALTGTYPNFKVDYEKVSLVDQAFKKLNPLFNAEVKTAPQYKIVVTWENPEKLNKYSNFTDRLWLVYYTELHDTFMFGGEDTLRSAQTMTFPTPRMYADGPLHIWAFFISEDESLVSQSTYLGTITATLT